MRGALANGLPDELVLCIMTRLPWPAKARCRCVSRAWNHALLHTRRPFLLVAKLMADYGSSAHDWRLLDPLSLQCEHIIKEDIFSVQPLTASAASRDAVFFHLIQHSAHLSWLNFDRMQWTLLPSPHQYPTNFMNPGAASFGAAIIDGYVYIAGGGSNRVQRLKLGGHEGKPASSWSWECLPDMHERSRGSPKALVLGGCLYVIGGTTHDYMSVNSGEVWDPRRREWTLMPELWPCDVFGKLLTPPNAVVARGRLYAITNLTRDIMYYEATTKVWKNLCSLSTFDHIDFCAFPVVHSLVAVGDELWVAVNTQAFVRGFGKVFTTTVTDPHVPPSWKLLPTLDNIRYTNLVVHL